MNKNLARPSSLQYVDSIKNEIVTHLKRIEMLKTISFRVEQTALPGVRKQRPQITYSIDEKSVSLKNRMNGFVMIVASRNIDLSARDIVRLYKEKDIVEKDFQAIKSFIKIRPIFHYQEATVRAHVSVCMLALYLEKYLSTLLKEKDLPISSQRCLETLSSCKLARIKSGSTNRPIYRLSQTNEDQKKILQALGMESLTDIKDLMSRIQPRH